MLDSSYDPLSGNVLSSQSRAFAGIGPPSKPWRFELQLAWDIEQAFIETRYAEVVKTDDKRFQDLAAEIISGDGCPSQNGGKEDHGDAGVGRQELDIWQEANHKTGRESPPAFSLSFLLFTRPYPLVPVFGSSPCHDDEVEDRFPGKGLRDGILAQFRRQALALSLVIRGEVDCIGRSRDLFYSNERFLRVIRRDRWLVLAVGIAAVLGLMATVVIGEAETLFSNPGNPGFYLFWACAVVDAWCLSVIMLYVGMRFLDFSNTWTRYGQEAILPFYVLHQPVIFAIAFFVVQSNTGIWIKLPVVVLSSFLVTIGLYELVVRRIQPLQLLFGMKIRREKT